jgi:ribosomal protein L11 methyltransferase
VAEAKWLEVSFEVDGEMAESVAELISRFSSGGVVTESGVVYNDTEDVGTEFGPVKVYGYLVIDEHIEETRAQLEEAAWHLGQIRPLPQPTYRNIEDEDWMASWKQHYRPIPIGKRLLILPAWLEPTDPTRVSVRIDPSMAFGTGTHPTTQLCLEMVEKYTQEGVKVIDVGCGSGILSIAALKMGAKRVIAVDIDNASIRSTRENAEANGVLENLEVGLGSVEEVRQSCFSIRKAPLVLANILAPVIIRLFDSGLADLVNRDGLLVLSGILIEQASGVQAVAELKNLELVEMKQLGDWVVLVMKKIA